MRNLGHTKLTKHFGAVTNINYQPGIRKLTKCGALYVQDNLSLTFLSFLDFCEILKEKYGDKYSRQQCLSNDFPNFKRILKHTMTKLILQRK